MIVKEVFSLNEDLTLSKMRKSNNSEIEKLTYKLNDIEEENNKLKELLRQNGNDLKNKSIKIKSINENNESDEIINKDNNKQENNEK